MKRLSRLPAVCVRSLPGAVTPRWLRPCRLAAFCVLLAGVAWVTRLAADEVVFLSDRTAGIRLEHQQQWGDFGFDRAAAATGGTGTVLQIGQTTYPRGLGHHANGEISIDLSGRFSRFRAWVGVQWQGGHRGSVIFRVSVDGEVKFQAGPLSDSDPAQQVDVPLAGARQLRLTAADAGDGFGCDMANWAEACLVLDPRVPYFGNIAFTLSGGPPPAAVAPDLAPSAAEPLPAAEAPPGPGPSRPTIRAAAGGFSLIVQESGPQVAVMESAGMLTVGVDRGEEVRWTIPVRNLVRPVRILADACVVQPGQAEVELSFGGERLARKLSHGDPVVLATEPVSMGPGAEIVVTTRGLAAQTGVRFCNLRYAVDDQVYPLPLALPPAAETLPPPVLPNPRPAIERELVEWDWRMQDGIGTDRERQSWLEAIRNVLARGDRLIEQLVSEGVSLGELATRWESVRTQCQAMSAAGSASDAEGESLWRQAHTLRRQIALANPLAQIGPLLFVKRVPSSFSHQLTQYSGRCARPGGGVFVLEKPGQSMQCRRLDSLPLGSYLHPDLSWDGRRVLFSFCETDPAAGDWRSNDRQFYHLYEMSADGSGLRQLTEGPYDDFSPRYLPPAAPPPDGQILFLSTRRGGFHRCGRGPCPVHTMAVARADGSDPRVISFHETHEWDPCVLNDGRVIYTRWDYVDRHAVHYQQLWSVRPDGSDVRAYYGNNTLNPVGVWEARPIPGSHRVMATAGAHHAMTAGSIITLDVTRGIDGPGPITRLTPDALFPESEFPVQNWYAPAGVPARPDVPPEERRWPGHCYRTPYPLSEDFFLAAYSFEPLIGEPYANPANMFGLYLVDRFGNKELLYRDVAIGSLWPTPLRARPCPPALPSLLVADQPHEGTFLLQDVYASWPPLSATKDSGANNPPSPDLVARDLVARDLVKRLRILQVLPKTTPNANAPRVGLANASPGKQVLGTVPVEPDGSAYFRAPAGIPLAFQALDERGRAIQTMRSLTYLQPGEQAGCVGCHEHRTTAPAAGPFTLAGQREPSPIDPGPEGSKPFNFARLVQPVLDRQCIKCHGGEKTEGGIDLTGVPTGQFTRSYDALAPLVPISEWKGTPQANHEPLTPPNQFGARASRLLKLLLDGHEGVKLSEEDYERLITWMDTNALFYGTFQPEDQLRQQRGEQIAGPALE